RGARGGRRARSRRRRRSSGGARGRRRGPAGRAAHEGVRPARAPHAEPRRRAVARPVARARLGLRLRGRDAHGRRARGAAAAQARAPRAHPDRAWRRLQGGSAVRSLRAREFVAIALAVLASVAVTLVVAVVLVRRSVRDEALKSLARQAALIAAQERSRPTPGPGLTNLGAFFDTQQERLAIVSLSQASLLLPPDGAADLRAGRAAQGSLDTGDRSYLYAAHRSGSRAIVL